MKKFTFSLLFIFSLVIINCKEHSNSKANTTTESQEKDNLDLIDEVHKKDLETAYFYVIAPNGLSLRKKDNLKSEKILTIPFGDKVKQTSVFYTVDLEVENISGTMMEVNYNGKQGYVYSGFVSKYPMPTEDEEIENYVERLKEVDNNVTFSEEETTPPDFHQGIIQKLELPYTEWHEAFYLAKAKFDIPKSFSFPSREGKNKETISQKDKEKHVWISELIVSRNDVKLDTLRYNWRAEGSGFNVTITEPKQSVLKIEYSGFVD